MFLALSRGCFSPRLRFFVDKIKKDKSLKCPILCISVTTCFMIVCMSYLLCFLLRWVLLICYVRFLSLFRGLCVSWWESIAGYVTEETCSMHRKKPKRLQNVNPIIKFNITVEKIESTLKIYCGRDMRWNIVSYRVWFCAKYSFLGI